ncbi:MAG: NADH-ubiquinone oxidoreductase-F iron-sulfur binding region domain-containing protein [Synechococcaceae cyanobacterium]|nr:NADH-ubiquinone oxidoreductase-F iron-sulfur binding region domain-containing protein [Synechococcaceae cyanobacterium]
MTPSPPRPPRELRICTASGCLQAGSGALQASLERAATGIDGPVPPLRRVGCLRLCGRGPLLADDGPRGRQLYGGLPEEAAALLLEQPEAPALEAWRVPLQQPFFQLQHPVVLEHCGRVDPESIDEALAAGTYATLRQCLTALTPGQVREQVRRSGLRGRGGAGYPTGLKWDTVALQPPGRRWVVCNADEGDPGAFMDRTVLESDPHRLIEGLAIAAFAVGADRGFVYVRAEYPLAIARLRLALTAARQHGWLGPAIAGSRFSLDLQLRVGAGAYVCGEETALLASISGRRGTPRPRPPYPAQHGLQGEPTLINNVETLAAIPAILRQGGDWYASIGSGESRGTKVFSLSGDVRHTGVVEVPLGVSLRQVVETMGGGSRDGRPIKAVQTGGPSGGCIPAALLDTPVDYGSLRELGSMLGSGGMVVIGQDTPMPALAHHFIRFSVQESCGKCLPCRAGTVQLQQMLERILQGEAGAGDLERLEELCRMVAATSLCGLGQAAPSPVLSSLRWFRHEYEAACAATPP